MPDVNAMVLKIENDLQRRLQDIAQEHNVNKINQNNIRNQLVELESEARRLEGGHRELSAQLSSIQKARVEAENTTVLADVYVEEQNPQPKVREFRRKSHKAEEPSETEPVALAGDSAESE